MQLSIFSLLSILLGHLAKVAEGRKKSKVLHRVFSLGADIFIFVHCSVSFSCYSVWPLENSNGSALGTATCLGKGQDELSPSGA